MTINEWTKEIHQNAMEHGWWDEERSFAEIVALCHSELSEALEECRYGRPMLYCANPDCEILRKRETSCKNCGELCRFRNKSAKPEGIAVEMIDCIIRVLDWLGAKNVDVEKILEYKHEYNKTRPYKHGKKF